MTIVARSGCIVALLISASLIAQERPAPDTTWRSHLAFMAAGSGVWIASNAAYRTADNGEPPAYGQHYTRGFGGTTLGGCLWGEYERQRPVFWHFFTAWDPVKQQFLVHQESGAGVVGLGYESLDGVADQTFTRPDGVAWMSRHRSERPSADTLVTQSYDRDGDRWQPRRTYTWVRQPTGTAAPC